MPVTLPPFYVNAPPVNNLGFGVFDFNQGFDPETYGFETNIFQGGMGLGDQNTDAVITLPPFVVTADRLPSLPPITFEPEITTAVNIFTAPIGETENTDVVTLPTFVVTENRITTPPVTMETPPITLATTGTAQGTGPVTLPPFTVTEDRLPTTPPITFETPNVSLDPSTFPGITLPPVTTAVVTTTPIVTTPPSTTATPQPTGIGGGGTATDTSTGTMSAKRDFEAELRDTLKGLQKYQPEIQRMYGDLYKQFMPAGITASEPGIINQYQADLARLQQRQAGMLSPEDVRQAQQSAREAYGARGQVMGPGAIGAELLNREAIRQQREDQARAGLQQSYGNILNMANLQTGNIFSPIASLMSGTFNPLGAYPADVYGTNVNAQLARDIAQSNKEAAIRSAELQGAAAKSAANTSLFGDFFKTAVGAKVYFSCMPGDQVIDTLVGPVAVENIKGGDEVIGYDGSIAKVLQVCSYVQDSDRDFFTFHLSNGGKITVCDRHKIMDIPASEWVVGATMGESIIERIDRKSGITTSYDLVTEVSGYRIAGVPVNSMIPEMLALTLQLVALKQIA